MELIKGRLINHAVRMFEGENIFFVRPSTWMKMQWKIVVGKKKGSTADLWNRVPRRGHAKCFEKDAWPRSNNGSENIDRGRNQDHRRKRGWLVDQWMKLKVLQSHYIRHGVLHRIINKPNCRKDLWILNKWTRLKFPIATQQEVDKLII